MRVQLLILNVYLSNRFAQELVQKAERLNELDRMEFIARVRQQKQVFSLNVFRFRQENIYLVISDVSRPFGWRSTITVF